MLTATKLFWKIWKYHFFNILTAHTGQGLKMLYKKNLKNVLPFFLYQIRYAVSGVCSNETV
jgi:hypothetical protein